MITAMGTKPKKPETKTGKPRKVYKHKYPMWGLRIPREYRQQVKVLAAKHRRQDKEQLMIILEQVLSAEGLWPPKKE